MLPCTARGAYWWKCKLKQPGLPLIVAPIPWPCSNADYEAAMKRVCDHALEDGITAIAFGDLFLTDVRAYRERQLKDTGLEPLFPIWGLPDA